MEKQWDHLVNSSIESNESIPLLHSTPQENCRKSRQQNQVVKWSYMRQLLQYILRFLFWSAGYNRHVKLVSKCYSMLLLSICWYQVIYEIFRTSGQVDFVKSDHFFAHNQTTYTTTQKLEYASYLTSAIGTACSYTFMLLCLSIMYTERSNAISPYVALKDMGNTKVRIILFVWMTTSLTFFVFVLLYIYISTTDENLKQLKGVRMFIRYFSISSEFLTQWMAMVSMFAFSCSSFAIGAFASDTFRRIKSYSGRSIDDIITIHKELRAIVTETTNAFSGWFLLHWLLYGITVVIGFVVVALHKLGHSELEKKIYFGTFFAISVFSFVFPCICAAYITTACAAIPSRINNTISADWKEGHLFQERRELQLFVSYCAASPVCFKIGRITFTSTLAWFSFFFGSTGLLFHFF